MELRDSGRARLRPSRVLMPARAEPRPPKYTFLDSQDHARSFRSGLPYPLRLASRGSLWGAILIAGLAREVEDVQRHGGAVGLPDRFKVEPRAVNLGHAEDVVSKLGEALGGGLAAVGDGPGGVVVGEEVEVAGIRPRRQPGRSPHLDRRGGPYETP